MKSTLMTLAVFVSLGLSRNGRADDYVTFVQLTDPHMFARTASTRPAKDDVADNRRALKWFIDEINRRAAAGVTYDFVVVTGDFGLEELDDDSKSATKKDSRAIDAAAKDLAGFISQCLVKTWLFVPGNNDLIDEQPDTIGIYDEFMSKLPAHVQSSAPNAKVIDLCPPAGTSPMPLLEINKCRFLGFNNASFKGDSLSAKSSTQQFAKFTQAQRAAVAEVEQRLNGDFNYAYVFYHIPEIDDPHTVTLPSCDVKFQRMQETKNRLVDAFKWSAWLVDAQVRKDWDKIVGDDKVKGLFAGHFHSADRAIYQSWNWMREAKYLSGSLVKLRVCPPIAEKRQHGEDVQARGFRQVKINCVTGAFTSQIVWYPQGATATTRPCTRDCIAPTVAQTPAPWALGAPFTLLAIITALLVYLGQTQQTLTSSVPKQKEQSAEEKIARHARAAARLVLPDLLLLLLLWLTVARIATQLFGTAAQESGTPRFSAALRHLEIDAWIVVVMFAAAIVLTAMHLWVDWNAVTRKRRLAKTSSGTASPPPPVTG